MKNIRGLIIAAPASGSGKTTVTLALLRHLRDSGIGVASAKIGPDFIDPGFHSAASGRTCFNLDSWAMRRSTLARLIDYYAGAAEIIIAEGVMGLFDGAAGDRGSTAEMAQLTGWPVVLVVDAQGMAASAAALVHGFASFRPQLHVAGVIFNRCGGPGHARLLQEACAPLGIPVLGCLPYQADLALPDRHLGLVQAQEHPQLEHFFTGAAAWVAAHLDSARLLGLAAPLRLVAEPGTAMLPLPGQRIAIAQDRAFAFYYSFIVDAWRSAGAEILPFSPLADQAPAIRADAIYLPGGYPELYAGQLAASRTFLTGLHRAAQRNILIYGECGGFMVLGEELIDADGQPHIMAGLLPVQTSFAKPGLHLAYQQLQLLIDTPLGQSGSVLRGQEFHFARLLSGTSSRPLFRSRDVAGNDLGDIGECSGPVMGSFVHLLDRID